MSKIVLKSNIPDKNLRWKKWDIHFKTGGNVAVDSDNDGTPDYLERTKRRRR